MAAASGAGFLEGLFDHFAGFARALLNPANQFILLAFGVLEIVIRELGPFLFQLALGDVPVAFDFECRHNGDFCCAFGLLLSQLIWRSYVARWFFAMGCNPTVR